MFVLPSLRVFVLLLRKKMEKRKRTFGSRRAEQVEDWRGGWGEKGRIFPQIPLNLLPPPPAPADALCHMETESWEFPEKNTENKVTV